MLMEQIQEEKGDYYIYRYNRDAPNYSKIIKREKLIPITKEEAIARLSRMSAFIDRCRGVN